MIVKINKKTKKQINNEMQAKSSGDNEMHTLRFIQKPCSSLKKTHVTFTRQISVCIRNTKASRKELRESL